MSSCDVMGLRIVPANYDCMSGQSYYWAPPPYFVYICSFSVFWFYPKNNIIFFRRIDYLVDQLGKCLKLLISRRWQRHDLDPGGELSSVPMGPIQFFKPGSAAAHRRWWLVSDQVVSLNAPCFKAHISHTPEYPWQQWGNHESNPRSHITA